VSLWFLLEPNGRRMWGSAPAAGSKAEAREMLPEVRADDRELVSRT